MVSHLGLPQLVDVAEFFLSVRRRGKGGGVRERWPEGLVWTEIEEGGLSEEEA